MFLHLALVENDRAFRVQPAGEIGRRHFKNGLVQFLRLLPQGDGMHVHHAINALIGFPAI